MDVAYCPECKKAGLRLIAGNGPLPPNHPRPAYAVDGDKRRWCPRCKKWVLPRKDRNVMVK